MMFGVQKAFSIGGGKREPCSLFIDPLTPCLFTVTSNGSNCGRLRTWTIQEFTWYRWERCHFRSQRHPETNCGPAMGFPATVRAGLFFGNVRDDKNLDGLLRAVSLEQTDSRPFIVIAGRTGGRGNRTAEFYRDLIRELELSDDVLYLDRFIENDEVGDLFQSVDFVPLTYLTTFTSQSAVLNVAMHFEKPILATPAPTISETVSTHQVGIISDDDSPAAIHSAMLKLFEQSRNGTEFGFDSYRRTNSWSENAGKTRDVYARLLKSSRSDSSQEKA